jgi:LAO/AO transport system kinase
LWGPAGGAWKPQVIRTIAADNKGIDALAAEIERFRKHFENAHERQEREIGHWKEWILQLLEARLMERVVGDQLGEKELNRLAEQVAARKMDPYAAVNDILAKSGLGAKR